MGGPKRCEEPRMTRRDLVVLTVALLGAGAAPGLAPPRYEPPPPPAPPGRYVWEPGHWQWNGVRYVWVPGRYVVRGPRYAHYVPGRWVFRGGAWVWVPAHWR